MAQERFYLSFREALSRAEKAVRWLSAVTEWTWTWDETSTSAITYPDGMHPVRVTLESDGGAPLRWRAVLITQSGEVLRLPKWRGSGLGASDEERELVQPSLFPSDWPISQIPSEEVSADKHLSQTQESK